MISVYPTRRAVALAVIGAPLTLAVGLGAPQFWVLSAVWIFALLGLMTADVALTPARSRLAAVWDTPRRLGVGRQASARLALSLRGGGDRRIEVAINVSEGLAIHPGRWTGALTSGETSLDLMLTADRRGTASIEGLDVRWRGPLGLTWIQANPGAQPPIAVVADVNQVQQEALKLYSRDAHVGQKAQIDKGEGSDFHALREFSQGMDVKAIDWKQSARHGKLLGREHRTERNHPVVLAIDSGRLMSAPVGGLARLDQAINAALVLAYVSLKAGDRVRLFSFDAKPRVSSGFVAGTAGFGPLQTLAAQIDYSAEETNFTLGLTTLTGMLERRSMIVMFTDFVDPTSAELMIENLARLMRKHLVLFVVYRDEELEDIVQARPEAPEDVTRAVISDALLQKRRAVLARLRRMGAQIIDPRADGLSAALVNGYLAAKRRELV